MKSFSRSDRVSQLIHREVSNIIEHELHDEKLGMITVTGVDLSKDLRNAKIFVSILGTDEVVESSLESLKTATGFIRMTLGSRVILKYLPTISFHYDTSTINGMYIDKLIDEIHKET